MMYLLKLLLYCFCLTTLNVKALRADGSFEDADQVNEFITMSFSSSHPYDLRQTIPGEPEIDYPIYSAVPRTNFDCNGRHEGYYADTEARCQVFRICANTDLVGRGFAFLCPNGTLFSQKNFVCDWYRNVDCNDSERYYSKNDNNRIGTKTDLMKTVRQMMEHPMKTISIALNRGKSSTVQPTTRKNIAPNPTKAPRNFEKSSSPANILPAQDNIIIDNQPIDLAQGKPSSQFLPPLEEPSDNGNTPLITTPSRGGFRPLNLPTLTITPPSPTFTPPFETPLPELSESPLSSENISYDTFTSALQAGSLLSPTGDSPRGEEVYVSSLGELSTDPGANFNRQTSRVIAESPSNELETSEVKPLQASGMNFAEKVNAGLNGLQVVDQDEVIAPEYVKNMMQSQAGAPDKTVQPVSFDFASNINSLLDEVNYEAQLRAQNSAQFQLQSPQIGASAVTKKPFRFLSRGFSHEKSKENRSYVHGSTKSPRRTFKTTQPPTSTQSYSNSLITTLITNTEPAVTSTETTKSVALDNTSEKLEVESLGEVNSKSEVSSSVEPNLKNIIVVEEPDASETPEDEVTPKSSIVNKEESVLDSTLESKPAIKREPKELTQLDSVNSVKDLSPEPKEEEKVDAKKTAEDLLLAGVKQITVKDPEENSKTLEEEANLPIVPIYNRAKVIQNSTPHITSSSTTSTISTTTASTIIPTSESSSTTDETTPTTTDYTTTPVAATRKFTAESGKRRQTLRPISYSRRNNLRRSGSRTTSSTTKSTYTTTPTYRNRLGVRSTSTTTAPNTTKTTVASRRRLNVSRYTYGSRRRTTESSSSTSSTTTSAPPSKTPDVQASDSALSDLTSAASTYNSVPNRTYNSIRQNSSKYVQTKRRRPSAKNVTSEVTTKKPSTKIVTTQQPKLSSSFPTPTLAPFSHHEALSPMPISSTTPESLPATYLSFNDLTRSITDDSILQSLRKNQAVNKPLTDSVAIKSQQQALPKQQIPFANQPRIQQDYSTQVPPHSVPTSLPFIPLKDFIASKFGPQYSPEPPKLSTNRPALIAPSLNNDFQLTQQKKSAFDQQYSKQSVPSTPVQYTARNQLNQNVYQQQSQISVQQQNQQQVQHQQLLQQQRQQQHQQQQQKLYQEQQLRLQQQQQKLQQLKQHQNHLQQQYQLQQQQQQKLQQQQMVQKQQHQVPQQQHFSTYQQQMLPAQQYSTIQIQQSVPVLEQQQQKIPNQPHSYSIHKGSSKIIPSVEQQFHVQQIQQPQRQQSQFQIIPSQMTVSQMILPQQTNIISKSETGSINVRIPSNLAGLIPNTNIFDLSMSRNSNSLESAQRRSDQSFEDAYGARERKSVFAGVSSYDVPLSSVGRLTNDITNFLRLRRL